MSVKRQLMQQNQPHSGRGAVSNPAGRFELRQVQALDDGWRHDEDELPPRLPTTVQVDASRSIITRNDSPDVPFTQSINPYRGCEHGCIYCFARPTHGYFNLSSGLDFETRLFYKPDAVKLLRAELAKTSYRCQPIAFGTNTDPYQPIEREYKLMRGLLELLSQCQHPVSIVTKGSLIERDLDLLAAMAQKGLASVAVSITSLRADLKRTLEPRAASPQARLRVIRQLSSAGIPVSVMVAPVIPLLTDAELEHILEAAADAGATHAGYLVVRLPHDVKQLFREWLETHEPLKAKHVMSLLNQMRGGHDNDPRFGFRQSGMGVFAELLARRFASSCSRWGLNTTARKSLDTSLFIAPKEQGSPDQLQLF